MAAIRWGLSVLDWRSHAIDERRYHPVGVYKAECGHLLMMVTTLHEAPNGKSCEACAAQQFVRAVKDDPDQIGADTDAADGSQVPALKTRLLPLSPDAATRVTLRIVAALPTPALRAGAFLAVLTHRVSSSLEHGATAVHCDNLLMHVQQRGHGNREGRRPCEVSADPLTPSATSSCGVPPGQELQGGRLRPGP